MCSLPSLTVLEESQVSAPAGSIGNRSLPLTFFEFHWLPKPPVNALFFYEVPMLTQTHFTQTIVPNLKKSLSIILPHFFPFAGNLIVFPSPAKKPEIRYVEGDSVKVTVAECNLDFNDLTGNHPRDCDKFYHLIPLLKCTAKEEEVSDFVKIPVFSVQVTLFPNHGFSMGVTSHHCMTDASTAFHFLEAWASVSRSGLDELYLIEGMNMPVYDRVVKYPKLDESYLKRAKLEKFFKDKEYYQPPSLSGPTDKVRATFTLTRTVINRLKKLVSAQLPTLPHVSSFTVACGYIWSCITESRKDELEMMIFAVDCRARMDPSIPATYFGNSALFCMAMEKTSLLMGKKGFLNAAKSLGESLYKMTVTEKDGIFVKDSDQLIHDLINELKPTTIIGIAGTPKFKFYDLDFGWGKPKKYETISIDYGGSISMNACKDADQDLEIGVCLSPTEMDTFVRIFNDGLLIA